MKKKRQPSDKAWQTPARVQNPELQCENSNKKRLGGITGKGFIPGQSGNPGGRPKGSVKVSSCYERALARPFPGDQQGRTYAQVIADRTVELAAEGRIDAIKEITDRTEGRSKQTIDVSRRDLRKEYLQKTVDDLSAKYGKPREDVMWRFNGS